jgi:short-subunit dehydrogenase
VKRCLVTGAAAGIGRALLERFGRAGHALLGVDVDAERARATERELGELGVPCELRVADLTDPAAVEGVLDGLGGPVDVLVNNAGVNCVGAFGATEWTDQRRVLDLNLTAPLLLTAGALARDLVAPGGTLVFVSSLSRFVGYPGAAGYAATKDGIASYARSLRVALAPRGLNVLTVYPGPTRTEHARRYSPEGASEERRMPPEELARRVFDAVERRRRTLVPGAGNTAFAALGHLFPALTGRAMKRAILDRLPATPRGRR